MAAKDKHYIEPREIRALRLTCENCGASQVRRLPQDELNIAFEIASSLTKCPECNVVWFNIDPSNPGQHNQHRTNVNEFVKYLTSLWVRDPSRKFRVDLEIAPDSTSCDKK
jgi:hypothetical protein